MQWIVCMGVAGSGKSSLGALIAARLDLPFIEGDDFHSGENRRKMHAGIALTDEDRVSWLELLGQQLAAHRGGAILACSALKKSYRDRLRAAVPGLRFVYLDIARAVARGRVAARAHQHLFPSSLVDSQFESLEAPVCEPGVLCLPATESLNALAMQAVAWITAGGA
ncbi:MAG TPA: gluconokinase [Steroidobacteraceae bacterium]|nr:gluconokinase [Steroidobacteraceae bacterium]